MKILVITNLYPNPYQPNRATFNRQQIASLAQSHEVRVISPLAWTDELRGRWRQGAKLPSERRAVCDEIQVEHPRYWYPPGMLRGTYGYCYTWSVKSVADRAIREFQPDLILATWAYPDGWAAVRLGQATGLPVVIKVHGSDVLTLGNDRSRRKRTLEALQGADRILAVSEDLAKNMQAMGVDRNKIDVHYRGVDTNAFSPGCRQAARAKLGLATEKPIILFVGSLVRVKGLDILLDACATLRRGGDEFECHLLGDGPLRNQLQREVRRLKLDTNVFLHGSRLHAQLPDWFRAANVFALPSRSEGVPNVLLESLACGLPFVASRVGGIPEIADFGPSTLVTPGDSTALADALRGRLVNSGKDESHTSPMMRTYADAAVDLAKLLEGVISTHQTATVGAEAVVS